MMKKLIALLALVGAIGFGGNVLAQDKAAAPAATPAAPSAPAPAPAAKPNPA